MNKHQRIICRGSQIFLGFVFWVLSFTSLSVLAESLQITRSYQTHDQILPPLEKQYSLKDRAKIWELKPEEYKRYLWLMKNTPSGDWYKNLDPAEVLALNADTSDEMMKYAKIQVRNMHARITRELAFDKLYSQVYRKKYPNEKPIMSPLDKAALNKQALHSGDRVWIFVGVSTPLGHFAYRHVIKAVQATPNTALDIYFVGENLTQKDIQEWAIANGIPRNIINKQVTLNYGNDRFKSITKGKNVNLPFIGVVHNKHFQPISLSSVL